MKQLYLIAVAMLPACATLPYEGLARDARMDVRYTQQNPLNGPDKKVFGCSATGDCDDRALCAACRLVKAGANPSAITVVVQGWSNFDRRASHNHMALEYDGMCLMGLGADAAYGRCQHPYSDKDMRTLRTPLPEYLRKHGVTDNCGKGA